MIIKTLSAMRLAAVPHSGPYTKIGPAFQKLGMLAGQAGLLAKSDGQMFGIYKDDPRTTPPDALRSAAAVAVRETDALPAGLVEERIDGGRYVCFLHVGPYEGLPKAWADAMTTFLASEHRRRPGASLEIYLNNPMQVKPADLQTEIAIPIE